MATTKKGSSNGSKTSTAKNQSTGKLPDSFYRGQDKKTVPQKDKKGNVIPG